MKYVLATLLFITVLSTNAQYNTGDTQLNASLVKIDADASVNFSLFKSDMSTSYNVSEAKINSWSVNLGMKAGDIYFALELARIVKRPVDDVIKSYTSNKQKGWGVIAKDLGIKPGSPEFHALKNSANGKAAKGQAGKGNGNKGNTSKPKGKKN